MSVSFWSLPSTDGFRNLLSELPIKSTLLVHLPSTSIIYSSHRTNSCSSVPILLVTMVSVQIIDRVVLNLVALYTRHGTFVQGEHSLLGVQWKEINHEQLQKVSLLHGLVICRDPAILTQVSNVRFSDCKKWLLQKKKTISEIKSFCNYNWKIASKCWYCSYKTVSIPSTFKDAKHLVERYIEICRFA
jgi:hypothetical protein